MNLYIYKHNDDPKAMIYSYDHLIIKMIDKHSFTSANALYYFIWNVNGNCIPTQNWDDWGKTHKL